jgi:hypothetical protein
MEGVARAGQARADERVHCSTGTKGETTFKDRMEQLIVHENLKFASVTWDSVAAEDATSPGIQLSPRHTSDGLDVEAMETFLPLIVTLLRSTDAPRIR